MSHFLYPGCLKSSISTWETLKIRDLWLYFVCLMHVFTKWTISHLDSRYSEQIQRNKATAVWMSQSLTSLSFTSLVSLPLIHWGLVVGNRFIWKDNCCHWQSFLQAHEWVGENNKNLSKDNHKPSVCAAACRKHIQSLWCCWAQRWPDKTITSHREFLWVTKSESLSVSWWDHCYWKTCHKPV